MNGMLRENLDSMHLAIGFQELLSIHFDQNNNGVIFASTRLAMATSLGYPVIPHGAM